MFKDTITEKNTWGPELRIKGGWANYAKRPSVDIFNWLVKGKNYRNISYFMGKSMVSCRFSPKSTHWNFVFSDIQITHMRWPCLKLMFFASWSCSLLVFPEMDYRKQSPENVCVCLFVFGWPSLIFVVIWHLRIGRLINEKQLYVYSIIIIFIVYTYTFIFMIYIYIYTYIYTI